MVALDIRQVLRSLARTPLFAGVVVLLLALGIGANALIFTAVNALLLRPLPVAHPEQLVRLGNRERIKRRDKEEIVGQHCDQAAEQ